jgi:hypothetical protein
MTYVLIKAATPLDIRVPQPSPSWLQHPDQLILG